MVKGIHPWRGLREYHRVAFVRAQASDGVGRRPRQDPILSAKTKGMFHSSKMEGLGMPTSRETAGFRVVQWCV